MLGLTPSTATNCAKYELGACCIVTSRAVTSRGNRQTDKQFKLTSSNGNIFRVTGPLWGESTRHRWIPLIKASDAELWCFLWSAPDQVEDHFYCFYGHVVSWNLQQKGVVVWSAGDTRSGFVDLYFLVLISMALLLLTATPHTWTWTRAWEQYIWH